MLRGQRRGQRARYPDFEKQLAKLNMCLELDDPNWEVTVAWQCYEQLRSAYAAKGRTGRRIAEKVIVTVASCPIPEVARRGRILR